MGNNITTHYAFKESVNRDNDNLRPLNSPIGNLARVHNAINIGGSPVLSMTEGIDANPSSSAITGNATFLRNIPPAYAFGIKEKGSNIPGDATDATHFPEDGESLEFLDVDVVSNRADRLPEDKNNAATPSGINASADTLAPPRYGVHNYADELSNYIADTLIPEVNKQGKSPLLLRPLAAIASWFGYHGFGQSNCLSCAASVADTLKQGKMYQAFPTQRGGRPGDFAALQKTIDVGNVTLLDSVERLASYLTAPGDLNIVLTIKRPPSLWRRVFRWVDGHACNIIKTGNDIFLVDAQKKSHIRCTLDADHELSTEQADLLRTKLAANITPELTRFVGAVDSSDSISLRLYNVGWER